MQRGGGGEEEEEVEEGEEVEEVEVEATSEKKSEKKKKSIGNIFVDGFFVGMFRSSSSCRFLESHLLTPLSKFRIKRCCRDG